MRASFEDMLRIVGKTGIINTYLPAHVNPVCNFHAAWFDQTPSLKSHCPSCQRPVIKMRVAKTIEIGTYTIREAVCVACRWSLLVIEMVNQDNCHEPHIFLSVLLKRSVPPIKSKGWVALLELIQYFDSSFVAALST